MMMGLGRDKLRELAGEFTGKLPDGCSKPVVFLPGTLVLQGKNYADSPDLAGELSGWPDLADWPVVLLVDSTSEATVSLQEFLWTFFTRFEP